MAGLKEFFEKFDNDAELQKKVEAAGDENALLQVITDAGYDVKQEDLKKFFEDVTKDTELFDSDLDNVAGGSSAASAHTATLIDDIRSRKLKNSDDILKRMAALKEGGLLDKKLLERYGYVSYLVFLK